MKKTIKNIITNSDIQHINDYIMRWQNTEISDPEISLLREVVLDIKNYDIPTQMAIYTLLTNDMNVGEAAKRLDVTKPSLYAYLHKWQRNVLAKFQAKYTDYSKWLDAVNDSNNSIEFYKLIQIQEEE